MLQLWFHKKMQKNTEIVFFWHFLWNHSCSKAWAISYIVLSTISLMPYLSIKMTKNAKKHDFSCFLHIFVHFYWIIRHEMIWCIYHFSIITYILSSLIYSQKWPKNMKKSDFFSCFLSFLWINKAWNYIFIKVTIQKHSKVDITKWGTSYGSMSGIEENPYIYGVLLYIGYIKSEVPPTVPCPESKKIHIYMASYIYWVHKKWGASYGSMSGIEENPYIYGVTAW